MSLVITPAEIKKIPDLYEREILELEVIARKFAEETSDPRFHDICCFDCSAQFTREASLREFVDAAFDAGWAVTDSKRGVVLCPNCLRVFIEGEEVSEEEEREDAICYAAHKGD
jgi:hypothetical protein